MPNFLDLLILLLTHLLAFSSIDALSMMPATSSKVTLYDMPVSNNGARCRIIIYKKGLSESEIGIAPPSQIGGLKSEAYMKVNPQGKMPALVCGETGLRLAESDTIARFLVSRYASTGPSFQPDSPLSNYICRIHDVYMGPIQSCMYRPPPFGQFGTRKDALKEYIRQVNIIENLIAPDTSYLCGNEVSLADATFFPSMVFARHMLPKYDIIPPLPPKINRWFENVKINDEVFKKVFNEIMESLLQWDKNGRFDNILGAGLRDTDAGTIFDKILAGEIPATVVKETEKVLAFKDINPAAPCHVLVIPKDRNGLTRISKATAEHAEILGQLMVVAAEIVRDKELGFGDGGRIVINDGPSGGQEVMHLHLHVLGGRSLTWPPG